MWKAQTVIDDDQSVVCRNGRPNLTVNFHVENATPIPFPVGAKVINKSNAPSIIIHMTSEMITGIEPICS